MIGDRPAVPLTDPFLAGLADQLDAVQAEARALTDGLAKQQINWQPDPNRWSIAQCLDHLTRTVRLYLDDIEKMIVDARARTAAGERAYREGLLSRWVISGLEPPPRMRVRTIRKVEPPGDHDPTAVLAEFEAAHARLRELIVAADGVSLRHARMRSPFVPLIRFTLGQVFAVNLAHARRHLWQARQVRQHSGFPAASNEASREEHPH